MKSSIAPLYCFIVAMSLLVLSSNAQAQAFNTQAQAAPVIDLSAPAPKPVVEPSAAVGDSYYQSQMLQEEVRQLRGLVEELNYELQRVKQRQMDDYLDLDRRLSALQSGATPADFGTDPDAMQPPGDDAAEPNADDTGLVEQGSDKTAGVISEAIAQNYAQASNLLLKQRDINAAALAFKQHVIDYPNSPYLANAYYWLGEIYLLQGQGEMARQAFTLVVEQHPDHAKALDATFKLGKIYHQLGETDRARELLEKAANGIGGAASKAQSYLKNNF